MDYSHVSRQFPSFFLALEIDCYPFEADYVEHIKVFGTSFDLPSTQPPPRPSPTLRILRPIPKSGAAIALER